MHLFEHFAIHLGCLHRFAHVGKEIGQHLRDGQKGRGLWFQGLKPLDSLQQPVCRIQMCVDSLVIPPQVTVVSPVCCVVQPREVGKVVDGSKQFEPRLNLRLHMSSGRVYWLI